MALDLADKLGISLADAKARLSREPMPDVERHVVRIKRQDFVIKLYLTPQKYL